MKSHLHRRWSAPAWRRFRRFIEFFTATTVRRPPAETADIEGITVAAMRRPAAAKSYTFTSVDFPGGIDIRSNDLNPGGKIARYEFPAMGQSATVVVAFFPPLIAGTSRRSLIFDPD
jgi:hypothetical protein